MNTKVIYFQNKSASGPFGAIDGEIESAENVKGLSITPAGDDFINSESNQFIGLPDEEVELLNHISTNLRPVVEFSLQNTTVPGWHSHSDINPSIKVDAPKTKDTDGWRIKVADALNQFLRVVEKENLAIDPFLTFYALRLTDGGHILPSSPVLLLPNTEALHLEGPDDLSADSMTLSIITKISRLRCRITAKEELLNLSDRIEAIDIFISEPLRLWHHSEPLLASHRASGTSEPLSWLTIPLTESEFSAHLLSVATFRQISSVPLTQLSEYGSFRDVRFNVPYLRDLESLADYRPDFLQHHNICAATCCRFSGRLSLADLTLSLPVPAPAAGLISGERSVDTALYKCAAVEIESVKEGSVIHSSAFDPASPAIYLSDACLPEWIFIPDPDARKLTFITPDATYIFPLKRHPKLNGAFYWCGSPAGCNLTDSEVKKLAVTLPSPLPEAYLNRDSYRLPGAIWRSGKNSSLYFPDNLLMSTDNVRIIALCRAFRASGLVATTSPTAYLFTTKGIYLLKEMDDGTLRDAGLIADYVLHSAESIRMGGTVLYFTTADGLEMQISGTSVKTVSSHSPDKAGTSQLIISAENPDLPVAVITRPIKLSSVSDNNPSTVLNLADIASPPICVELLGDFSLSPFSPLEIRLYGSCNLSSWRLLALTRGRRQLKSVCLRPIRFLRLELSGGFYGSIEAFSLTIP